MEAGRWYFTPDPIVVTDEGYVVNGQHRLAAADAIDWSQSGEVPQFLVVWGVDKKTALLMTKQSGARMTADTSHLTRNRRRAKRYEGDCRIGRSTESTL
jgi:hypothetical protein